MIRGKMQERDEEIEALSNHVNSLQSMMEKLIASLSNTTNRRSILISWLSQCSLRAYYGRQQIEIYRVRIYLQ